MCAKQVVHATDGGFEVIAGQVSHLVAYGLCCYMLIDCATLCLCTCNYVPMDEATMRLRSMLPRACSGTMCMYTHSAHSVCMCTRSAHSVWVDALHTAQASTERRVVWYLTGPSAGG